MDELQEQQAIHLAMLQKSRVSAAEEYEVDKVIGKVGDATISTLGNFSTIIGKAKSVSALVVSALLDHPVCGFSFELPRNKHCVLYFDTEQLRYHTVNMIRRIHRLAGLSVNHDYADMRFLCIRKYTPE